MSACGLASSDSVRASENVCMLVLQLNMLCYNLVRVIQASTLPVCDSLHIKSVVCLQQQLLGGQGPPSSFFSSSVLLFFVGLEGL